MKSFLSPFNLPIQDWHGKRVWVVGASSGIGAALAEQLAQLGAKLIVSARRKSQLQDFNAQYPESLVLPFDVQNVQEWESAAPIAQSRFGGIDLIVFCAATYRPVRTWEFSVEDANQTIHTNLSSVYYGLHAVLPTFLSQGHGGIAIIASVAGYLGLPQATVYGPTKAALINLAEILYNDLHDKNIGVYLINPGFVKTELTDKNTFTMPALQTPSQAAAHIVKGLEQGKFEIHFPKRFTFFLKLIKHLPYYWQFKLVKRVS
jgi:short-subunit dehydrogenase